MYSYSFLLNGPITLMVVLVGSLLNALTIYVLSTHTLSRGVGHRQSSRAAAATNRSPSINNRSRREKQLLLINKGEGGSDEAQEKRKESINNAHPPPPPPPPQQQFVPTNSSRPRIYAFLLWLAISDTALLISALLMYCFPTLFQSHLQGLYIHFTCLYYLLSNAALTASVWLMCALIFDRYRTICRPFKRSSSFSTTRIHKVLGMLCILALGFSLPRFFELTLSYDQSTGEYWLTQTALVRSKIYMVGYRIVGGLLLYSLLPYLILFFLSFKVWLVMREATLSRLKISSVPSSLSTPPPPNQPNQTPPPPADSSEAILVCVMAKFLVTRLAPTALDVVEHWVGNEEFIQSQSLTLVVDSSNLLVVIASGANFFIFYAFSHSFRRASTRWCCCGQRGKKWRTASTRRLRRTWHDLKSISSVEQRGSLIPHSVSLVAADGVPVAPVVELADEGCCSSALVVKRQMRLQTMRPCASLDIEVGMDPPRRQQQQQRNQHQKRVLFLEQHQQAKTSQ